MWRSTFPGLGAIQTKGLPDKGPVIAKQPGGHEQELVVRTVINGRPIVFFLFKVNVTPFWFTPFLRSRVEKSHGINTNRWEGSQSSSKVLGKTLNQSLQWLIDRHNDTKQYDCTTMMPTCRYVKGLSRESGLNPTGVSSMNGPRVVVRWSCRFSPTGRSADTGIPS